MQLLRRVWSLLTKNQTVQEFNLHQEQSKLLKDLGCPGKLLTRNRIEITEQEFDGIKHLTDEQIEQVYGKSLRDIVVIPNGFTLDNNGEYSYYPPVLVSIQSGVTNG